MKVFDRRFFTRAPPWREETGGELQKRVGEIFGISRRQRETRSREKSGEKGREFQAGNWSGGFWEGGKRNTPSFSILLILFS